MKQANEPEDKSKVQKQIFPLPVPSTMNSGPGLPDVITQSSHPVIAGLHIIIKIAIVFIYLIFPFITSPFNVLITVVIASAIDFWIVKNLAGRLLVGLRWWIDFDANGDEQWKFECKVNEKEVSPINQKAFWWTMALFVLAWTILSVINVLKLDLTQITICLYCLALLFFNLYSYYQCSKVQKQNVNRLASEYGTQAAARFMRGSIISAFK